MRGNGRGSGAVTSPDQLAGRGVAAGGLIEVYAQSGHLVRAEIDRDLLRLRAEVLADQLMQGVNNALDDARSTIPAPDPHDVVDLEAVARDFSAVRDQAAWLLQAIVSAIQDAAVDLAKEGKLPADVGLPDAERLLQQMQQVDSLLSSPGPGSPLDTSAAQARGHGQAGGLVRAAAVPPGGIGHLDIDPEALRDGPEELARLVVTAVNAALDSLEQMQREQRAAGAARRAELKKQFQDMNEAALAQIRDFGSVASSLLGGLGPGGAPDG